ncbi:hypothetical protein, partial [Ectothiorhodospira shaposhnikovii]|uniref:hypothetical protein n=1 Tax=Ectothiorhodospira shaposhnikovii TaxID=1054 RepID=UPI001A9126C3
NAPAGPRPVFRTVWRYRQTDARRSIRKPKPGLPEMEHAQFVLVKSQRTRIKQQPLKNVAEG